MKELFNRYKRKNKTKFNNDYKLKNNTHLIHVVTAIMEFEDAKKLICDKYRNKIDTQVNSEYSKLINNVKENENEKSLIIKCIMQAEKIDKHQLLNILEKEIIEKVEIEGYLEGIIKTKEQGKNIALALAIIDDYMDYLEGKGYNGPATLLK